MLSILTERPKTKLLRLPKRECANYGTGLAVCNPCRIEKEEACGYFERNVLPLKKDLAGEYFRLQEGKG